MLSFLGLIHYFHFDIKGRFLAVISYSEINMIDVDSAQPGLFEYVRYWTIMSKRERVKLRLNL